MLEESLERETGKAPGALSDEEAIAWLKTRPHPALVAAGYQERRSLVGEEVFPLYKITLRYVLIGLAVAYAAVAFLKAWSSEQQGVFISVPGLLGDIVHSGLMAFAVITLIFHFCGKYFNAGECLANWNPKDLPDPTQKWEQESRSSSVGGLVFTGIFLLVLNGLLLGVSEDGGDEASSVLNLQAVTSAVEWLPWINAVLIASILLYGFMIVKPYWSATTLAFNAILSAGTAIIAYHLQGISPLFEMAPGIAENAQVAEGAETLLGMVNTSLRIALLIVCLVSVWEVARDIWRLSRLGTRRLI